MTREITKNVLPLWSYYTTYYQRTIDERTGSSFLLRTVVTANRSKQFRGDSSMNVLEELNKEERDRVSARQEAIVT
jgi:hypothetical protein